MNFASTDNINNPADVLYLADNVFRSITRIASHDFDSIEIHDEDHKKLVHRYLPI